MDTQETILRTCTHDDATPCVTLPGGETLRVCSECWNEGVYARRAERKAELAAMPRCELCKRRGTSHVGSGRDRVLLCGRHTANAKAGYIREYIGDSPFLFLPGPILSREEILELARKG